jgi:hypothetical protein
MDELMNDFLRESGENLDRLDQDFVKLEKEAGNPDLLKSVFRTIHTIKLKTLQETKGGKIAKPAVPVGPSHARASWKPRPPGIPRTSEKSW